MKSGAHVSPFSSLSFLNWRKDTHYLPRAGYACSKYGNLKFLIFFGGGGGVFFLTYMGFCPEMKR